MSAVLLSIRLQLNRLYWTWMLREGRQFRAGLEVTIVKERERAKDWVEHAELMERRAEMAIIAAQADTKLKVARA